jgi:hypothetical protein
MVLLAAMKLTILSGGQTGVDRAALFWAIRHGVPHGGWCPSGRWSEDGPIPGSYHLRETPSPNVEERTLWNVRDSDGTAIFSMSEALTGGTAQTARFCVELGRPLLFLAATIWTIRESALALRHFLEKHHVRRLNIAGPRASEQPEAAAFTRSVLGAAFPYARNSRRGAYAR